MSIPLLYLDHSATEMQLVDLLAFCNGSIWTDRDEERLNTEVLSERQKARKRRFIRKFNKCSRKRFSDLYTELTSREIVIYRHTSMGVAIREAKNVKALICNPARDLFLIEVSRTYINGETVPNYGDNKSDIWSYSETMMSGETPLQALKRGLGPELGIDPDNINPKRIESEQPPIPDLHISSAYKGLWSSTTTTWFAINTYQLDPRFPIRVERDNGVILNREWFTLADLITLLPTGRIKLPTI